MSNQKGQGRKPKPTHLKLLHGEPNKDRINENEPKPAPVMPKMPTWLDTEARKEWKRIGPDLLAKGVITEWDMVAFANYCSVYGRLVRAEKEMKKLIKLVGPKAYIIQTPTGTKQTNPYIWVINKCIEQLRSLGSEFGLTPSSRTKIKVEKDDPGDDFFD
jgi:P27 family predicted phage terminase small subunit